MTQEPLRPHRVIAERVAYLRRHTLGWSAQRLAEEMTSVGIPWDRSIVANFETGRRSGVSVEELFALADVLGVAPAHLMLPVDDEEAVIAVTPTRAAKTWQAREWLRGRMHLRGQDGRRYHSQVPQLEMIYPPKSATPVAPILTMPEPKGRD